MWFKKERGKGGREGRRRKRKKGGEKEGGRGEEGKRGRRKKVNCMCISDLDLGTRLPQCIGLFPFLHQGACDGGEACDGEGGEGCLSGAGGGGATTGVHHPGGGEGGEHCESAGEWNITAVSGQLHD